MTIAFLFWLLFILWVVFGVWSNWPRDATRGYSPLGDRFIIIILLFIIGWRVFGFPIRDSSGPAMAQGPAVRGPVIVR